MKIDYLLTGLVNDNFLEVRGHGDLDKTKGIFILTLDSISGDPDWDPATIIFMCCENMRFYSAQLSNCDPQFIKAREGLVRLQYGGTRFPTEHRSGIIHDRAGNVIVSLKAKGFLFVEDDVAYSRTVITECTTNLAKFGGISEIKTPYTEIIVPGVNRVAIGVSAYNLVTADGTELEGLTKYPYIFHNGLTISKPLKLTIHTAKINAAAYRAGAKAVCRVGVEGSTLV
jgi:hypothetical protein